MMAYESKNAGADRNLLLQRNDEKKMRKMSVDNLSPLSTLILITAEGFEGIPGALLIAVGGAESFSSFGFYSLDFSNK